jgi:hypothetical protein
MLTTAITNMLFTIGKFNNWGSFGFIIGIIFVYILLVYSCALWEDYDKDQRLRVTPSSVTSDWGISMMA